MCRTSWLVNNRFDSISTCQPLNHVFYDLDIRLLNTIVPETPNNSINVCSFCPVCCPNTSIRSVFQQKHGHLMTMVIFQLRGI